MESVVLAKPNYQFEKRQRDLEKKKKQEEKRLKKLEKKSDDPSAPDTPDGDAPPPAADPSASNS